MSAEESTATLEGKEEKKLVHAEGEIDANSTGDDEEVSEVSAIDKGKSEVAKADTDAETPAYPKKGAKKKGAKKKKGPTKRKRPTKAAAASAASAAAAVPSAKKSRSKMTIRELKAELKKLGLPVSGKKAVLLERLNNA